MSCKGQAGIRSPRPPWRVFSFLHACWVVLSYMNEATHNPQSAI